ncbi:MAG: hypothetical protein GSR80_001263 [Desulfurococcales archaeon]|nr:hypothetical protein [Desulfurococcales archaeon]
MSEAGPESEILRLLEEASERLVEAYRKAMEAGLPYASLPIRTMILPVLKEIVAQLDGYRNDFVADPDLEMWPRIGSYAGGRLDFEVKRVKWEEV